MNKILAITWKDISILLRDRPALMLIILGPLVLTLGMGLITNSFNQSDAPTISRIPVVVIDRDGGQLATALTDLFTSEALSDLLATETSDDEPAALERVSDGDVAAVVIIPAGFSDSFIPDAATGETPAPVALRVVGDPGSPIRASVVRGIAEEFTNRAQTGVTTVQVALTELATSGAAAPAELPAIGQAMAERLFSDTGGAAATDSLITVRSESVATDGEAGFNLLSFFAPAMALMFLMYAVTLGARTLLSERREGTLARMLAAPVTNAQVLSGKVAGIFLGGFIQLAVLVVLTSILFRLNWGNPLGVLLVVVSAALAATGWGLLIASASANAGQVSNLGMALTLIFGILGGFIPGLQSGAVFNTLSRIAPNSWAMDGFLTLASGAGLSEIVVPVAALLAMAAILFVVSAIIFRRRQSEMLAG
mgnify:CR=1 FL=1